MGLYEDAPRTRGELISERVEATVKLKTGLMESLRERAGNGKVCERRREERRRHKKEEKRDIKTVDALVNRVSSHSIESEKSISSRIISP